MTVPADPIKRSRRANLSLIHRAIIHWLPTPVYRQILREYDIARAIESVRTGSVQWASSSDDRGGPDA